RPAPHRVAASAAALASLSILTGTEYFFRTAAASGKSRQQGTFGGLRTTPALGSRGPGAQMPIPAMLFDSCGSTCAIAETTESSPRWGEESQIMATRT